MTEREREGGDKITKKRREKRKKERRNMIIRSDM